MTNFARIPGISASAGIAVGPARVIDREKIKIPKLRIAASQVEGEVERLRAAVRESERQLREAEAALKTQGGGARTDLYAMILEAYLVMVQDESFIGDVVKLIAGEGINAEWALSRRIEEIRKLLAGQDDEYLRERSQDVAFVGNRIQRNLLGHVAEVADDRTAACIVVADNLSPVETTQMVGSPILGFTTEGGTSISHTAIVAQAMGIPAVVGVGGLLEAIRSGDVVIVDGNEGTVIVRPDAATTAEYLERAARHAALEKKLVSDHRNLKAVTTDGVPIELLGNIEFPAEAAMALDYGADGIGLYRTEFLFLKNPNPGEEEQYRNYRTVVETLAPKSIVFRTFDLGSDKLQNGAVQREDNPALGLRAIRLSLRDKEMFKVQLRALIRASSHGDLRIMFPMISGVGELREVKAVFEEARRELAAELRRPIPIGCMIELPSAVMVADQLAREVDFFSIGTNDLIQYSLAIDRVNDDVAYLYSPFHPSILRSVRTVVEAGRRAGIPVAICGTLAVEPLLVPLLIGFGLRSLSMTPSSVPIVKALVRSIDCGKAEALAERAMELATAEEVEALVRGHLEQRL